MTDPREPGQQAKTPLLAVVDAVPLAIGLWLAWRVLGTMWLRLNYDFDLEWMEGGILAHGWQLVHDKPLYPEPNADHIAFVYPPGYSALLALLGPVFGLDYALGRALSILGTLAAALALVVGSKRQGGHLGPGLAAACLYLSLYNASGAFYDLVRPDAVAVGLFAWALVFGLERDRGSPLVAGTLLAAAFATKHNLAIFGLPILLHYWVRVSREHALRFAVASIGPALLFTGWMHVVSDGHFLKYLIGLPGSHSASGYRGFPGTPMELVRFLFPGLAAAAVYLGLRAVRKVQPTALALPLVLAAVLGAWGPSFGDTNGLMFPEEVWVRHAGFVALGIIAGCLVAVPVDAYSRGEREPTWTVGAVLAGVALVICALMRAHHGGFINVLMPLHWVTCLGFAVLAGRARDHWPGVGHGLTAAVAVIALYWTGSRLELDRLVPTLEDRAAGERAVADIVERCPNGPILSPYAAWLPVQAGHAPSIHLIAIWDIDHTRGPYFEDMDDLREATADHYWECVIEGGARPLEFGVGENYRTVHSFHVQPRVWMPRTGWRARPKSILQPR